MTLPLNDTGEEMLDWLPRWLQSSGIAAGIVDVEAREADRLETDRLDLLAQAFVQTATGDWGLDLWESALQLPVDPEDGGTPLTDAQRRAEVFAHLTANIAVSGAQWRAVLDQYTEEYTVRVDHENGVVYLTITYNPSAYSEAQLETLLESITPAHLTLNVTYEAFLADISEAGDPV